MTRGLFLTALIASLSGCTEAPTDLAPALPVAGAPLPAANFDGVDVDGRTTTLRFADLRDTDAELALVVVSGGTWCGTCRWLAAPLDVVVGPDTATHLHRLDILLGDHHNGAPTIEAARAWQALGGEAAVAADPDQISFSLVPHRAALPWVLLVDTATLNVANTLANPTTTALREAVAAHLETKPTSAPLIDGFDENEWALLKTTTLPSAPPSITHPLADDPAAATLGEALFFDTGLSPIGVACASCHQPEHHLHNAAPVGEGASTGHRRVPSVTLAAHAPSQLWDGRAESLADQALLPLEDPTEMASTRSYVARYVLTTHRQAYEHLFGAAPDTASWPVAGKPGDAAFDALSPTVRETIDEVFFNVGQVIEAWERRLRVAPNALDAYVGGDLDALNAEQKYGLRLFVKRGCQQCHWGPRLTDDAFHNVGFPGRLVEGARDRGRFDVLGAGASARHLGQFKTPPLRGVAHGVFFGHAGRHNELSEVMSTYGWRSGDPGAVVGTREPWLPAFGETAQWGLVPFLLTLTAERVDGPD